MLKVRDLINFMRGPCESKKGLQKALDADGLMANDICPG